MISRLRPAATPLVIRGDRSQGVFQHRPLDPLRLAHRGQVRLIHPLQPPLHETPRLPWVQLRLRNCTLQPFDPRVTSPLPFQAGGPFLARTTLGFTPPPWALSAALSVADCPIHRDHQLFSSNTMQATTRHNHHEILAAPAEQFLPVRGTMTLVRNLIETRNFAQIQSRGTSENRRNILIFF